MTSGAPRPEVAVGAVCVHRGELLLVQRGTEPERGRWSLPGGRVEAGETVADALRREVREETGLVVEVGELVGWAERQGPGYHFVILDLAATVTDDRLQLVAGGDADAAQWVALDRLEMLPLVSGLADFLADRGVTPAR